MRCQIVPRSARCHPRGIEYLGRGRATHNLQVALISGREQDSGMIPPGHKYACFVFRRFPMAATCRNRYNLLMDSGRCAARQSTQTSIGESGWDRSGSTPCAMQTSRSSQLSARRGPRYWMASRVGEPDLGQPVAAVAQAFGISERTATKWCRRVQQDGPAGLRDRSFRPHRSPRATPAAVGASGRAPAAAALDGRAGSRRPSG